MRKRWEIFWQNSSHRFIITKIAVYPPFNVWFIPMVSKMQNFMCKFRIMSWKRTTSMSMASVFLEVLGYSDTFWVSSQVFITCHDSYYNHTIYTKSLTTSRSMFFHQHNSRHTHASSKPCPITSVSNKIQKTWFMMSPSDLAATPSSEWLQERCSRHRHWETKQNERQENCILLHLHIQNCSNTHSTPNWISEHCPPFKLRLVSELSNVVLWNRRVNLEST